MSFSLIFESTLALNSPPLTSERDIYFAFRDHRSCGEGRGSNGRGPPPAGAAGGGFVPEDPGGFGPGGP
jgi:hypothetical protein